MIVNTIDEYDVWFLVDISWGFINQATYNWGTTLQEQGFKIHEPFIMRIWWEYLMGYDYGAYLLIKHDV